MLKRFLLHFTHDLVGVVDGGGDLRTIAVLQFHRFGQMGIGRPHLELKRLAAGGKTLLDCFDLCFLCGIEFELAVQQRIANSIDAFLKAATPTSNPYIGSVIPQLGVI